ncbi:MAG: hypothetical protein HYW48_11975 [Deltaproteobacteria bacterium]|nr:hypothetical protein [Deltaproteobacteria bacterium]
MFASTAYEAFYTYIGLYLHQASIAIITSQEVLMALMLLILGCTFMLGTWRYFSKYMPGIIGGGRTGGAGFFVKIFACFLLGVSLLKVDTHETVKSFQRESWSSNPYIYSRLPAVHDRYQVSFIFSLLTRAAEEFAKLGTEIVDLLFKKTNSELDAPAAFYRAVMFAGAQTIDDPGLTDMIDVYTNNCFDKVLPILGQAKNTDRIDEFFKESGVVDQELKLIPIVTEDGGKITCLDLKKDTRRQLLTFAQEKGAQFSKYYHGKVSIHRVEYDDVQKNLIASNALVNHYLSKSEDSLGTASGAQVEGTLAKLLMDWGRFWSFDGFLNLIGQGDQVGAALTAKRASQFSEYLQRAPHLKGMVKLFLIAIFPWLIFFVIAGRWRVLVSWFAVYISVLLWTPIWSLLYHLMTSIALSNELLAEFGRINDGVSLYASSFITAKLYQFYAIYSWLQLIVGPLPTLVLGYGLFSAFLKDSETEQTPTVITAARDVGIGAATGGVSGAAGAAIKKV